ncbi:lytic polysaccharide monooxygenase [Micromonospora sp. NPDC000089]|uniref:lytic polysaccharide monooxygenase auxiliary activity family 9 protein n=1 Tax=unclassified Micromonospora TaxID=2617518 RepID=UPI00368C48F8
MTVRRMLAAAAAATVSVLPIASPATAHGAPTSPLSRSAACGPEGAYRSGPACQAAVSAGAAVREWDNIRVYGVNGRDRERIPDGELCSGGMSAYRGLDLPRADWPATEVVPGARFIFRYRGTIPHSGTFRFYATRPGYQPGNRLNWADLADRPFLTVTDPPMRDGAYQMPGRLPTGLTGRHLIYTVWQNSSTPDTYYSCSDVVFRAPGEAPAAGGTASARPAPARSSPSTAVSVLTAPAVEGAGVPVASVTHVGGGGLRLVVVGAAAVTVLLAAMVAMRLRRAGTVPVGRPCGVRNHRAGRRRIW